MPNYDYKCDKCGHQFEEFQTMMEEPLKQCPRCGGDVRRMIGAGAGLIFKGSGFYITDYKKSGTSGASAESSAKENKPVDKNKDQSEVKGKGKKD